jgi:hypothetical protein
MMRTLGQYMVGSAATFGYVQRVRRHSKFSFLTILQLLHVHWHDHPHRELAHPYRSFRQGSGEPRRPSHHEEEEGTDDAADPGSVDGNMKNGGHVQKTKLGLEVASPRRRMYYTERNFKPITSIMGKYLFLCTLERESVPVSWCIFELGCPRYAYIGTDCYTLYSLWNLCDVAQTQELTTRRRPTSLRIPYPAAPTSNPGYDPASQDKEIRC